MFLSFYFLEELIMKNIMVVLILVVLAYGWWNYLQDTNQKQTEIDNAKQELWLESKETQNTLEDDIDSTFDEMQNEVDELSQENTQEQTQKPKRETFVVESLTPEQFLEFDTFSQSDLDDMEIELTGKTLANVDSIRVLYSNDDSDFPDDDYTLGQFEAGNERFLYRAFKEYKVFDYGTNVYTFIAKSWEKESKLQLTIFYPEESVVEYEETSALESTATSEINLDMLPRGSEYGNPVKVSESTVSYSDIPWLEISAKIDREFVCENDYILSQADALDLWIIWWNTCIPTADKKSLSFYILSIKDGVYTYAKHYVSLEYYGILELESEEIENYDDLESIADKNTWLKEKNLELKKKNDTFSLVEITDNLFKEIIK